MMPKLPNPDPSFGSDFPMDLAEVFAINEESELSQDNKEVMTELGFDVYSDIERKESGWISRFFLNLKDLNVKGTTTFGERIV